MTQPSKRVLSACLRASRAFDLRPNARPRANPRCPEMLDRSFILVDRSPENAAPVCCFHFDFPGLGTPVRHGMPEPDRLPTFTSPGWLVEIRPNNYQTAGDNLKDHDFNGGTTPSTRLHLHNTRTIRRRSSEYF